MGCLTGCETEFTIDLEGFDFLPVATCPDYEYPAYEREMPTVNLVPALRQANWKGSEGEGSCVHATMIMLFRWQGRKDLATLWKSKYENGERYLNLASKFDNEGVRYAYTWNQNDVGFLEWACATRRGCGVTVRGGRHMVMLVYLDSERAGILDNNAIGKVQWVSRRTFLSEWYNANSWAVTPVYAPSAPLPSEGTK
jgi:hypothetical protein